jgi:hypothetical protein
MHVISYEEDDTCMSYHMRRRIHACHMKRRRMPVQTDKIMRRRPRPPDMDHSS